MRLPVLIAAAGLTSALAACNTTGSAPTPLETASSGAPAPVEGYDWFLHQDGDTAKLAYGVDETDDMLIGLDCEKNSGRLTLNAVVAKDAAHEFHLESGGDTERYPAHADPYPPDALPSDTDQSLFLTAEAKAGDPVFQRFRRLGWLAVWTGEQRHAYAPHPGSGERIEQFFAFCG